jgi:arylsulfatase A-like enzyme
MKMERYLTRRDFLKLAGLLPLGMATPRLMMSLGASQLIQNGKKNVLVVVFDAFSASHLSLNGYQRETTPNLVRLAERAVVYHNHYAGGSFTPPGTASLLTGTLPWTHRAFQLKATVAEPFATQNFFSAFQNYYRIAYTHNGVANIFLEQFSNELDELVPWKTLFLQPYGEFIQNLFEKDSDIVSVSWTRNVNIKKEGYAYSLFLSHLYEVLRGNQFTDLKKLFPRGLPSTGDAVNDFLLENAIDWTGDRLTLIPQPFFGYFHFLPPHGPYNTSLEFTNRFSHDGFKPVEKPEDIFSEGEPSEKVLKKRIEYDEFLLYIDKEFNRLFNYMETSGLLENTWVIFTSDHGEIFERGTIGHSSDALYQPQIRIPLLIFEPGRKTRMDVHTLTSAVDVLPTLSHVTGHNIPDWTEGVILPPYADSNPDPNRNVYVMKATKNDKYVPITHASMALIKERYKLLYYFGDVERGIDEMVKLYDIEADPEELVDLYPSQKDAGDDLLDELKTKLAEVDKPYL